MSKINELRENELYKDVYLFIETSIGTKPELIFDDSFIVLKYTADKKPEFQICFWLNEDRVSFFLEEFEIIDEYLKNINDTIYLKKFIEEILTNEVALEKFKSKKNKVFKKVIEYSGIEDNRKKVFSENHIYKFKFPWIELDYSKVKFIPWVASS